MKHSAQLEREAERSRADVEETLEELRSRLRPGQLVDQLVEYARDGAGAEFYGNLKRQVAENPLPVTVIGAGLAWLALASNSSHPRRARSSLNVPSSDYGTIRDRAYGTVRDAERRAGALTDRVSGTVSSSMESAGDAMSDMARTASDTARRSTARLRDAASNVGDRVSSAYTGASDAASRTTHAFAQSVSSAGHSLADSGRSFADFCREQPLVLAGIGVALGAALGAMLPSTETEDRLMGDTADRTKERVQGMVGEQVEKTKALAEEAADKAIAGAQETVNKALESADAAQSESREAQPDGSSDEGRVQAATVEGDVEWTTRDGSGRAADTGYPPGERPSNG